MAARTLAVAVTLLSFTACTTLRPIPDFSPSRIRQQVDEGDRVRIVALTGAVYELRVTQVGEDFLQGRSAGGKSYKVHYEAIRSIEVQEVSGWAVAWGAFGGAMAILYVATIAALIAFFSALD